MNRETITKEARRLLDYVPELGERYLLRHWVADEDAESGPTIDFAGYGRLLSVLPDGIVENLERARLERAGVGPMLRAGLGYEELLGSIIVDGTAIASSSAEARLVPAWKLPGNFLQPGGIPGRTLHWKMRGRQTTLATAATLTFRVRDGATDVFTNTLAASGALTMDAAAQTNTQWFMEGLIVVRSVGSAGTVFAQGDATSAAQALTIANQTAQYMGSAGSAAPAAVTVDETVDRYWNFTAQWSLATAYSIQAHVGILESLN